MEQFSTTYGQLPAASLVSWLPFVRDRHVHARHREPHPSRQPTTLEEFLKTIPVEKLTIVPEPPDFGGPIPQRSLREFTAVFKYLIDHDGVEERGRDRIAGVIAFHCGMKYYDVSAIIDFLESMRLVHFCRSSNWQFELLKPYGGPKVAKIVAQYRES